MQNFADRLDQAIEKKSSCLVVGLDPVLERLPGEVLAEVGVPAQGEPGWTARAASATGLFLRGVIDSVAPHAVAVKPNAGFFERFGAVGMDCLREVSEHAAKQGLLVICDAKRGDIGHTAAAYAESILGETPDTLGPVTDAVTLNPYLGEDSLRPFLDKCPTGKGLFILVRTSNPSGSDIQELQVDGEPLYLKVARLVGKWGEGFRGEGGLNPVGVVVGATAPGQAAAVRKELPEAFFLVPGYGAQGGGAEELAPFFIEGGKGVVVNSSRSVLYAFDGHGGDWRAAVAEAASRAREDLEAVRSSRI